MGNYVPTLVTANFNGTLYSPPADTMVLVETPYSIRVWEGAGSLTATISWTEYPSLPRSQTIGPVSAGNFANGVLVAVPAYNTSITYTFSSSGGTLKYAWNLHATGDINAAHY